MYDLGRPVTPPIIGLPTQFFLTTTGIPSTTHDATGNYSVTPADFHYISTAKYELYSLLITISDNATFNQGDYGGIVGGLTNGVKLFIYNANLGLTIPLLGGNAVKKNYEWITLTHDTILTTFSGTAQTLMVNFDMIQDYGQPIHMEPGDKFIVRVNDDLTTLVSHTFGIRGIKH